MHHRMPPSKTGCTSLNMIFPPVMHLDLDDPKQWPPQDIIDQIHKLISEDHQILPKSIAEQLGISHERVGSIIHEDLDMRKLSAKWVPKCLNADQKRQRCQSSEQLLEFSFGAIQMISRRDLWPWTKPGYMTITRLQSNNQWSGSIAAYPVPKNSECKNPLEKFSPRFFGIKTASSSSIIFQTRRITHLCWCNWRTFWRKNAAESSPRGSCIWTTMPRAHRALATQKTLAYMGFQCLDHPPYSPNLAPSDYHLFPELKKTTEKSPFFVRRGGHCCHGDPVGRTTLWIFLSGLQKVEQRATSCIELCEQYVG